MDWFIFIPKEASPDFQRLNRPPIIKIEFVPFIRQPVNEFNKYMFPGKNRTIIKNTVIAV